MTGYVKNSAHLDGYPFADETPLLADEVALFTYEDSNSYIDSVIVENVLYDSIKVSMFTTTTVGINPVTVAHKRNVRAPGRDAIELVIEPVFLGRGEALHIDIDSRGDAGWSGSSAVPNTVGVIRVYGKHGV